MTKDFKGFLVVLGLAVLATGTLYAAAAVRGAKAHKVVTQSTTGTAVHTGPTTIYALVIGTGAVTDYVVLLDSANATGAVASHQVVSTGFRGRFYASSATANTNITFDPPLLFNNGLSIINATAVMTAGVTYEPGRAAAGY